ncbi:hypothetical protein [Streptomyces sp. AM6-12]|uniref:hypothetical protein n=1 Tax=Streptomyces sp. AM6-12 TaxID=3345149 RepID=UPI0037B2EDAE
MACDPWEFGLLQEISAPHSTELAERVPRRLSPWVRHIVFGRPPTGRGGSPGAWTP